VVGSTGVAPGRHCRRLEPLDGPPEKPLRETPGSLAADTGRSVSVLVEAGMHRNVTTRSESFASVN